MKTSRAVLLMLAALAGGTGLRLAFSLPAEMGKTLHRQPAPSGAPDGSSAPGSRPQEPEILTATGGPRLRLLLAWLPAAGEEELLRLAEALHKPEGEGGPAFSLLMARWAEVNPRAMLEWARAHEDNLHLLANDALTAWARLDFDSAWAACAADKLGRRAAALQGLVWSDPDKCLRILRSHTDVLKHHYSQPSDEVIHRLLRHNPAGVAALFDSSCGKGETLLAGDIALAWAKTDPAAAVAWLTKPGSLVPSEALKEPGVWLASHAPEQLPALLKILPPGPVRGAIENAAFAHLAATDPDAARRRLESMPASPARQFGRALLLKELLHRGDESGALTLASQLGWALRGEWHPAWHETVRSPAVSPHPKGWAASEDYLSVQEAMQELMGRLTARDPKQAAAILAQSEGAEADWLITGKPETHPAALADALLAAGDEKSRACFKTLTSNWAPGDPASAAAWAVNRGGADGDALAVKVLEDWSMDVDAALAWAANLTPGQRLPLLQRAVLKWHETECVNVAGAVRASALPAGEKQQLLDALPPP